MFTFILAAIAKHAMANSEQAHDLPARFIANRVVVEPSLANGKTLSFFTDTGGGANMLCRDAAERAGLELVPFTDPEVENELGKNLAKVDFPAFRDGAGIPANAIGDTRMLVYDCRPTEDSQGFLSSRWFDGRVWTWDYPNGKLRLESNKFQSGETARPVELGFKADKTGKRQFAMPRIVIRIDNSELNMLLDTGATTTLMPAALTVVGDMLPTVRATSFIAHSRFEQWHKRHPQWRIIDAAEVGTFARMIEVAEVDIAGFEVGPVWFTERPDTFRQWMGQMMDKVPEGAIGGDALSYFTLTVDYPNAVAYFRCSSRCQPTPQSAP